MNKVISGLILLGASSTAMAAAPGGSGCGWGNMLFEGQNGPAPHILGVTTNGTTFNNTFGMAFGTNGCDTTGSLTYGGKSILASVMSEFSEDVARGEGEALDAVAVLYGVEKTDRNTFATVMHENFSALFPNENVTAEEVQAAMNDIMKSDARLAKYVA